MHTSTQRSLEETQVLAAADVSHLFHPSAPIRRSAADALIFRSASGVRMIDTDGNEWIDVAAGLVNVNVGYGRAELADTAARATRELSYANPFFGRGCVSATQLGVKLAEITPPGLEWFFFTIGGSDANDSVIKFARYYNTLRDKPEKKHIIGRIDSFHGSTVAATSMSGNESNWSNFGPRLPDFSHIPQPGGEVGPESLEEEILRIGPDKVAMFIAEPISTPPRVNIPPDDYWPAIREICTKYDVLMSFDEVITGFGRTGKMFAAEHWGIAPDLMQMSKGITSGYFPLGAVGLTEEIADVLALGGELNHGFTTGGHPVGCAVALENIRIMEDEDLVARGAAAGARLRSILEDLFVGQGLFSGVRGLGSLSVIDFDPSVPTDVSSSLAHGLDDQHLLVRSYGNGRTIGFAPSLAITDPEIDEAVARFGQAISEL